MNKNRLEAFTDGVLAVIITILVLELKTPGEITPGALKPILPLLLSYVLTFLYIGVYWNNHHHLLHATQHVSGAILWANLHLLFWLSLTPFATAWMGESQFSAVPVALYGCLLLLAAMAYFILTRALVASHGETSVLAVAIGKDRKGTLSVLLFSVGIPLSFVRASLGLCCYFAVIIIWLIPDRRIEKTIKTAE